jgi:hypothetical protein
MVDLSVSPGIDIIVGKTHQLRLSKALKWSFPVI